MEVEIINDKKMYREEEERQETIKKEFKKAGLEITGWFNRNVTNPKKSYWGNNHEGSIHEVFNGQYLLKIDDEKLLPKYKKLLAKSKFKWMIRVGEVY